MTRRGIPQSVRYLVRRLGLCMAEATGAGPLLLRRRLQLRDYRSSAPCGC
jgi:hypothetical protein